MTSYRKSIIMCFRRWVFQCKCLCTVTFGRNLRPFKPEMTWIECFEMVFRRNLKTVTRGEIFTSFQRRAELRIAELYVYRELWRERNQASSRLVASNASAENVGYEVICRGEHDNAFDDPTTTCHTTKVKNGWSRERQQRRWRQQFPGALQYSLSAVRRTCRRWALLFVTVTLFTTLQFFLRTLLCLFLFLYFCHTYFWTIRHLTVLDGIHPL